MASDFEPAIIPGGRDLRPVFQGPSGKVPCQGIIALQAGLKPRKVVFASSQVFFEPLHNQPAFERPVGTKFNLILVSNADLGRPAGCSRAETYRLGQAAGLHLCYGSDTYDVLCQAPQSVTSDLIMAMDPLKSAEDLDSILEIVHKTFKGVRESMVEPLFVAGGTTVYPGDKVFAFSSQP